MTDNINKVFDEANSIVNNCILKIEELETLKQAYQIIGKEADYKSDIDNVFLEISKIVNQSVKNGILINGILNLSTQYKQMNQVDGAIKAYTDIMNDWIKIRDRLDKE